MIKIDSKHQPLLLEALEDLMYKISLQLAERKGQPMGKLRKTLTEKQEEIEEIQHHISSL